MKAIPIVAHGRPDPPRSWAQAVKPLAAALLRERPELALPEPFASLRTEQLNDGPALVLDDLSEISGLDREKDPCFYQDRARLRAGDTDVVVSCAEPVDGLEKYCRDTLGLGSPDWLRPPAPRSPLRLAEACWEHDETRHRLIEKMRQDELQYIHPHMGTLSVWELAYLLQQESHRSIGVIAPPPGVCEWANSKIAFANVVVRLFGPDLIPRTESANSLAYIAKRVSELSRKSEVIGLKLPRSAGGAGNLVINTRPLRQCSLSRIREILKERLAELDWDGESAVLIDCWETEVVCSPSAQLWIPPLGDKEPVFEGVFVQTIEGAEGSYVGNAPAEFPHAVQQEIIDRCWVLALLFQKLGYVGRCSFDMILVGSSLHDCRIKMIECNGRWGGTSLPMTLMNRIFGDWYRQPYAVRVAHHIPGLNHIAFRDVIDWCGRELFDNRVGTGSLILINPGRLKAQGGITLLALGESWQQASEIADRMPHRLRQFVASRSTDGGPDLKTSFHA